MYTLYERINKYFRPRPKKLNKYIVYLKSNISIKKFTL